MAKDNHAIRATERDLDLLDDLGDYRFLSAPQVATLHFPSLGSAKARLQQLHAAGLCARVFMPARPYERKVATIFALGSKGAKLLAPRHEGAPPKALTDKDKRSALFLDHTLRRNDVRVCLELLHRERAGFTLLAWKQKVDEVRMRAELSAPALAPRKVPVVPDGFFVVRVGGELHGLCLEVDMGTVNKERMSDRFRGYLQLWKDGALARRFGAIPMRVLTMTTTASRLATLRQLACAASPGKRGSGLFWFALLESANIHSPEDLLGPCWTTGGPGPEMKHALFQ